MAGSILHTVQLYSKTGSSLPVSIKAELTYGWGISDGTKWQLQPKQLALFMWLAQGHHMYQWILMHC